MRIVCFRVCRKSINRSPIHFQSCGFVCVCVLIFITLIAVVFAHCASCLYDWTLLAWCCNLKFEVHVRICVCIVVVLYYAFGGYVFCLWFLFFVVCFRSLSCFRLRFVCVGLVGFFFLRIWVECFIFIYWIDSCRRCLCCVFVVGFARSTFCVWCVMVFAYPVCL